MTGSSDTWPGWHAYRTFVAHCDRGVLALLALTFAAVGVVHAQSGAAPQGAEHLDPGVHRRLQTAQGIVHVWTPPGYVAQSAGVVVYVHGYRATSDSAWEAQRLREQFLRSRCNALFVVPESPASGRDAVRVRSLAQLRVALSSAGVAWPTGPAIAVAHSGGYRTVAAWIEEPQLAALVLLDAFYGDPSPYGRFLERESERGERKLVIVAASTALAAERFVRRSGFGRQRASIPDADAPWSAAERAARLLYVRSQYGHSEMVDNGRVLPRLLELVGLGRIAP